MVQALATKLDTWKLSPASSDVLLVRPVHQCLYISTLSQYAIEYCAYYTYFTVMYSVYQVLLCHYSIFVTTQAPSKFQLCKL